jgi:membrane protein DedA with SNARE-associated domain
VDCWAALLVATPRRVLAMMVTYGMGAVYGRAILAWSTKRFPRIGRAFAFFERVFVKVQRPLVLLWPAYVTTGLAGVTRMPLKHFVPFMVLGQIGYVVVVYYLGDAMGLWTDRVIAFFSQYLWESTGIFAAAVALQQLVSYVRRRRAARRAVELERANAPG